MEVGKRYPVGLKIRQSNRTLLDSGLVFYPRPSIYGAYAEEYRARVCSIRRRKRDARSFRDSCTLVRAHQSYMRSRIPLYCYDTSYGFSWVAVHSIDDSVCVVARRADLDTACLGHKTMPKHEVMKALTNAIVSEVEGIPSDGDLCKRVGLIPINKPFGVVTVCPAGSVEVATHEAASYFLMENANNSVINVDDAIKTAISAFKCLYPQELKAEEYSVTTLESNCCEASHLTVPMIEKHLAGINKKTTKTDEQLPVMNMGFGESAFALLCLISCLLYKGNK